MAPQATSMAVDAELRYRRLWEEAARDALTWRRKYEALWDAIEEYRLWEPGRKGYAAARRELERAWLDEGDGER